MLSFLPDCSALIQIRNYFHYPVKNETIHLALFNEKQSIKQEIILSSPYKELVLSCSVVSGENANAITLPWRKEKMGSLSLGSY